MPPLSLETRIKDAIIFPPEDEEHFRKSLDLAAGTCVVIFRGCPFGSMHMKT
jgi:hypothetical protein